MLERYETEWTNLNSQVKRLPMTIERLPGQHLSAETTDPSVLVTPDTSVFMCNYAQPCPVFVFRHFDSREFIPTQITLWSKMHTESSHGYPVGKGLIFVADSPVDLLDVASAKQFEGFTK